MSLALQVTQATRERNMDEASWSKAVSNYFSTNSLPSHALGLIHPDLPNIISHQQSPSEKNIDLSAEADWLVAIRKTLARQSTYNNVISEILKGITRIVGWMLLTLSLYGNVFTDLKRRRREADDNLLHFGDIQTMMKYILAIHE
eukprot:TRINITY_DN11506_c0_g1_i1.p1 TRINITY_DN11506_c0_g1~~TRINITY_DN11506_c0_g1_i1.p1  ORF type:complete len:163 (+),score=41.64 TRINITY_DN11506_c0_g1_i1:56-490(+)